MTFEDAGVDKTRLTVREIGIPKAMAGFAALGWNHSLDKMAAGLRSTPRLGREEGLTMSLPSDHEVLISRVFWAPRDRVFRAFTDPKAIPDWWGPKGYTTRVVTMDVRPGGVWRYVQHDLEGKEHAFHGVYREVAPPERLSESFEYEGAPGHVVEEMITFEALPGSKTKLTVLARFANQEDRDAMISEGMEWGMRESYERLEALLVSRS